MLIHCSMIVMHLMQRLIESIQLQKEKLRNLIKTTLRDQELTIL